jgi:hypothetical protein
VDQAGSQGLDSGVVRGPQLLRGCRPGCEAARSPAEVLGPRHPLAHALDLTDVLRRQAAATAVVLVASATSVFLGADWAWPPLIAAAVVQLVLAALLISVVALSRDRARDLLNQGRDVDLPVVARERRRLLAPRCREALAASLEDLVRCAWRRDRRSRMRPVYEVFLVREVASELLAVVADLRVATAGVCGVARVERLLTIGTSPLYGTGSDELRAELARITAGLAGGSLRPDDVRGEPGGQGGRGGRSYASTSPRRIA